MAKTPDFESYIGIPYNFTKGPSKENKERMFTDGANCQLMCHAIVQEVHDKELDEGVLSKEIYEDDNAFPRRKYRKDAKTGLYVIDEDLEVGDVMLFGPVGLTDPKKLHLTNFTGLVDQNNSPLLFHQGKVPSKGAIWSLDQLVSHDRYAVLYAVKTIRT